MKMSQNSLKNQANIRSNYNNIKSNYEGVWSNFTEIAGMCMTIYNTFKNSLTIAINSRTRSKLTRTRYFLLFNRHTV